MCYRMTTSIDVVAAQQTQVVYFPKLLTDADLEKVRKCQQDQVDSGIQPQQHLHKRRTFLNGGGAAGGGLQGSVPDVLAKLLNAASQAKKLGGWGEQSGGLLRDIKMRHLRIRVVEFWEYEPGGGLVDDYHYDSGSVVTIVCLVNNTDLTGGVFRTFEPNGTHAEHILECGDVLCLLSHKYHNVTPVITGHRQSLVIELFQGYGDDDHDDDDDRTRMASDQDSGFVACGGSAAARQAIRNCESRLEFVGIKTRDELGECLKFVEELMAGPITADRPLDGLSFASCSLTSDDLDTLGSALRSDAGKMLTAFSINQNPGVDRDAWNMLWARLPEKASWLDFGDNQLVDADVAHLIADLPGCEDLVKLYLDGNKLRDLSGLCKALPETNIISLDLGDNDIDDTNVAALSSVLARSAVKIVVLGTNPISAAGLVPLIEVLPRSSIEEIYIDHTAADDLCLAALSNVLKDSKLTELHMDSTKITDAGVRDFLPHISASELSYIDVGGNGVSDATVKLLDKATSP
eukprot:TRINITY_DN4788_c0_g1_i1.p1 TRINITY_DN4788_c0_g1~~TRINITY_DN4788_c0_g1_i1.p1  ORF type:complete len:519 (+),score=55.04 TRINITY_DN4788_c0_g1_i1:35-1591(+)